MTKLMIPIILIALLSGCATTSAPQSYRPENHKGAAYQIWGKIDPLASMTGNLIIYIDGEEVINHPMQIPLHGSRYWTKWKDKKVEAVYHQQSLALGAYLQIQKTAQVFIDGELAANLTF